MNPNKCPVLSRFFVEHARGRFQVLTVGPYKYASVTDHAKTGVGVSYRVEIVVDGSINTLCHWVVEVHCIGIIGSSYWKDCNILRLGWWSGDSAILFTTKATSLEQMEPGTWI